MKIACVLAYETPDGELQLVVRKEGSRSAVGSAARHSRVEDAIEDCERMDGALNGDSD